METKTKTPPVKTEAQKAATERAVVKVVDATREKIGDKSIVEALVSDVSNVKTMLDERFAKRLVGRIGSDRNAWSRGDLLVAGVALRLSHKKEDCTDVDELLSFVHGKARAVLGAALSGAWKSGAPFHLNMQSATEVLEALNSVQFGVIRKAREAMARLEATGDLDKFLLEWRNELRDSARNEVRVFNAARTGEWPVRQGQNKADRFFWNESNAFKVLAAVAKLDGIWASAVEFGV
jgi:hypothetical protein